MNPLLKLAIRGVDVKCQDWETKSETDHLVPDGVEEFLDRTFQGVGAASLGVDVFRPKDRGLDPLPVIVMIHGGGLFVGSRKLSRPFCEYMASKGFLAFAPDYRLATDTDAVNEIGDVYSALSFVSDVLEEYGGDPGRVTVVSESAGSFLALFSVAATGSSVLRENFGLNESSLLVRGLASFSGMFYTTRRDLLRIVYAKTLYGDKRKNPSFMKLMNPECPEVMDSLPPVFLVGSDRDFLKGYTKHFDAALREAEHPCKLLYYTGNKELNHAFPALKPDLPESREVWEKLIEWIGQIEDAEQVPNPSGAV